MQHSPHHDWPEVGGLTFDDEIHGRVDRARQLRAEAVAKGIVAIYDGLAHALRAVARWWARRRREAETRHALERCSDRTLADVGIRREDIPLLARGHTRATAPGLQAARHPRLDRDRRRGDGRPDVRAVPAGQPELPRAA